MSEKLVFIANSREEALSVVTSLKSIGLTDDDISAIAYDDTPLDNLPDANIEFESDALPGAKRGIGIGGATGLLAGLAAVAIAPAGLIVGGAGVALATAGGATYGAFVSALIGSSVPNSQIREYEDAMEKGDVLLIVEVDSDQFDATRSMMRKEHPTVDRRSSIDTLPPAI